MPQPTPRLTRRELMQRTAAVTAALGLSACAPATGGEKPKAGGSGRIKQSLVRWCYDDYWQGEELARVAKGLGCQSVELIDPEHWP
ncbi:MAG: twin-arginine translocation signal domain-containing protein, partial [Planctomycetaceae bacterium]